MPLDPLVDADYPIMTPYNIDDKDCKEIAAKLWADLESGEKPGVLYFAGQRCEKSNNEFPPLDLKRGYEMDTSTETRKMFNMDGMCNAGEFNETMAANFADTPFIHSTTDTIPLVDGSSVKLSNSVSLCPVPVIQSLILPTGVELEIVAANYETFKTRLPVKAAQKMASRIHRFGAMRFVSNGDDDQIFTRLTRGNYKWSDADNLTRLKNTDQMTGECGGSTAPIAPDDAYDRATGKMKQSIISCGSPALFSAIHVTLSVAGTDVLAGPSDALKNSPYNTISSDMYRLMYWKKEQTDIARWVMVDADYPYGTSYVKWDSKYGPKINPRSTYGSTASCAGISQRARVLSNWKFLNPTNVGTLSRNEREFRVISACGFVNNATPTFRAPNVNSTMRTATDYQLSCDSGPALGTGDCMATVDEFKESALNCSPDNAHLLTQAGVCSSAKIDNIPVSADYVEYGTINSSDNQYNFMLDYPQGDSSKDNRNTPEVTDIARIIKVPRPRRGDNDLNVSYDCACAKDRRWGGTVHTIKMSYTRGSWDLYRIFLCTGEDTLKVGGKAVTRYGQSTPDCDTYMSAKCLDEKFAIGNTGVDVACSCIREKDRLRKKFANYELSEFDLTGTIAMDCFSSACNSVNPRVYRLSRETDCNASVCQQMIRVLGTNSVVQGYQTLSCNRVVYNRNTLSGTLDEPSVDFDTSVGNTSSAIPGIRFDTAFFVVLGLFVFMILLLIMFGVRRALIARDRRTLETTISDDAFIGKYKAVQ